MERCRFYQAEWPKEGEVVVARVTSVGASGTYVILHEYGDKEAMLPHSELSNRRLRSVHKHVRPAQLLCVRVTRVDQTKGGELSDFGARGWNALPSIFFVSIGVATTIILIIVLNMCVNQRPLYLFFPFFFRKVDMLQ